MTDDTAMVHPEIPPSGDGCVECDTWSWDYRDDTRFEGLELAAPTSHPVTQAVPGPADRLPGDWLELLGGSR